MEAPSTATSAERVDHWIQVLCALSRDVRHWQAALDAALRPQQLGSMDFLVLWVTGHAPPPGASQVDIARNLAVSAAQVCSVVETLQLRGWLQTLRSPRDRRRHCCSLTVTGETLLGQLLRELGPTAEQCLREEASLHPFVIAPPSRIVTTQEKAA